TFLPVHLPMSSASIGALSGLAPTLVRVVVPFHYSYPVNRMIRALKFRGERVYARVLGTQLALARRELTAATPSLLVPMPLHVRRYRDRGFNQSESIAQFAATHLGVQVDPRLLLGRADTR